MNNSRANILFELDWVLIFLYIILVVAGWFSIYATTYTIDQINVFSFNTFYGKQLIWIGLSFFIVIIVLSIEASFYERFSSIFYIISMLLLVGLFIFGKTVNGQTAWYSFGSFRFQPAEIVKTTTALAVAKIVSDKLFDMKKFKDLKDVLIILLLPFLLILFQPDFGSAIVYTSFIFVLLREKLSFRFFVIIISAILIFISTIKFGRVYTLLVLLSFLLFFIYIAYKKNNLFLRKYWPILIGMFIGVWVIVFSGAFLHKNVLKPHHKDRLALWLRLEKDPQKIKYLKRDYGYNNDQSVKTIASGGMFGKGFLEGDRTNGKFVPEQHTDYVFSAIGEEFGFFGTSLVVVLFMLLILRIIQRAEIQKSKFSRVYGYGLASILFFHFVVNIGMVIDLLPTVGIPLPFFSYGGSSLWGFTILLFIFIKLDANRTNEL